MPPSEPNSPPSPPPAGIHSHDAVLLIAHGSRRAEANADIVRLANLLAPEGQFEIIETAYLELATPDIPTGGAKCVERGATRVRMLPYFLSAGAHVVDDLKSHRDQLGERFPEVEFVVCPPLGLHPLMVEIVRQRLSEFESTGG